MLQPQPEKNVLSFLLNKITFPQILANLTGMEQNPATIVGSAEQQIKPCLK